MDIQQQNRAPARPGEMASLIEKHDWSGTLGPIATWPQSLKTIVGLMIHSPVPLVLLWGPDGIMIYNDGYAVFAGNRHPGLLGSKVLEGWPEAADLNAHVMAVCMAGGTLSYKDEELALNRRGKLEAAWMDLDYSPVPDESGKPGGVIAIVVETTERVLAERAASLERERVAESEHRLQLALSVGNGIGTWDWDVAANKVVADARFARLYGVDPAKAADGASIDEYFNAMHPDDMTRVRAAMAHALKTGEDFMEEYRLVQPDGSVRWVAAQGVCDLADDGTPTHFPGVSFDITERKKAEIRREALVKLTDSVRAFDDPADLIFAASTILGETLNVSRVSYGTIDHDAETLTVDRDWLAPGVETLAGTLNLRDYGSFIDSLKAGEFIAIDDVDFDDRTASAAAALKARSAGAFVNVPVLEKGRLMAVLFINNAKPRPWKSEDLALVQEIAERVRTATERLRATKALREANATLEARVQERTAELNAASEALRQSQKMEAVGQLTGGIAHDFNNLLQGITGALDRVQHRIAQGRHNDVDRFLKAAVEAANRAASLTHRLLAFSRRQTLDPRPIEPNRLVAGMEDMIRRTMGPNITIEVVGAAGLWPINADPSQLENTILNLCINARDAMPNGGALTIETANKWLDDRAAREREVPPGQYVSVCVTDTGTGMTPDVIARAFDPFFTTKPLGRGTGLGLSMIYGFVRQSGGQVRVYSEVGQGTTMCLYFPRYMGTVESDAAAGGEPVERGFGETVLVVDDEETVRMLIAEVLSESYYNIVEAGDGAGALKILEGGRRIDLMITDVGLPGGMNGRQVADAARRLRPELKVLFITGYAENAVVGNGHLEAGMEILAKPFAMSTLANKVREIIEG